VHNCCEAQNYWDIFSVLFGIFHLTEIKSLLTERDFIVEIEGFDRFMLMLNDKLKQIWLGWSLGGPLSIFCQTAPPSVQDGCCY
jgi:hypothetical protein